MPTLWLDTSVLIKLTKLAKGEIQEPRLARLREVIVALVKAGKLAVVEAEQEEEFAFERLDWEIAAEIERLTRGVDLRTYFDVARSLALRGMETFAKGESELILGSEHFFARDPALVLAERHSSGVIAVASPGTPVTNERRGLHAEKAAAFETFRADNRKAGVTYEQQLAAELSGDRNGWLRACIKLNEGATRGEVPDPLTLLGFVTLTEYRDRWNILGGRPADLSGVFGYLDSEVYKALPTVRIGAQLWADILTGNEPLKAGDSGDVELLSVAIPACSFVLADNRQRLRVEQRNIAEPWGARVFSMNTVDQLIDALERL